MIRNFDEDLAQLLAAGPEVLAQTRARIAPWICRTPVIRNEWLDEQFGAELFFKCENLQHVGAFKMRGASNAVLRLAEDERRRGVATHSSGNHAQALARAAALAGVPAWIVMPHTAPRNKIAGVEAWGAQIRFCEPTQADREHNLAQVIDETGANPVPPYDDPDVILGQATCTAELLEQCPGLDAVIAPIGGGGLLAGAALALRALAPGVALWAGEPAGADDSYQSLRSGQRQAISHPQTIADGLLATIGERPFAVLQSAQPLIQTVSEAHIVDAMQLIFARLKQVVEPSAAVALAALSAMPEQVRGRRIGVILTGGNVDLDRLAFQ